jgi:DnaK suppressor protein
VDEAKQTSTKELAAIKKQLLARKQEIDQELKSLLQEKFSDDQVQDVGDQALSSSMENLKTSLQNTKLEEYRRIEQALTMIEDGTYGICIDCHTAISDKRLKSFPNATRCLSCQEIFEENGSSTFE